VLSRPGLLHRLLSQPVIKKSQCFSMPHNPAKLKQLIIVLDLTHGWIIVVRKDFGNGPFTSVSSMTDSESSRR